MITETAKQISGRTISYAIDANYWKGGADNMVDAFMRFGKRQLAMKLGSASNERSQAGGI